MKKIILLISMLILLPFNISYAEEEIIESTGIYTIGDGPEENISTAKERAKMDAMRNAIEKAGVYIESYSKTESMVLTKDEVHVIAGQIIKIISSEITANVENNGSIIIYKCKIKSKINTDDVKAKSKTLLQDKMLIIRNIQLSEEIKRLETENDKLKKQYTNKGSNKTEIQKKFSDNEIKLSAMQWCDNAKELARVGNDIDAVPAFTKAIQLNPNLAVAYDGRASCYIRMNDLEKALKDYNYAIRISNKNHDYYNYRKAQIYNLLNKIDNSIECIEIAINLNPNDFHYLILQGSLYQKKGDYTKAKNSFNNCFKLPLEERDDCAIYVNLSSLEKDFKHYDKHIEIIDKLLKIYPKNHDSYVSLYTDKANSLVELKRNIDALNVINEGISIYPNNYRLYDCRAEINLLLGNYNDGIDDYTKAIILLKPKDKYDINELAHLYESRAYAKCLILDKDSAIKDINQALKISPKVVNLSRFMEMLSILDEALSHK
jgi:tetratricopeptide (TPR) repeat protein